MILSRAQIKCLPVGLCRSCKAQIIWARTDNGRRIPIDAEPVKRVILDDSHGGDIVGASLVDTFMPHHATCPNAEQHRKAKAEE